MTNRIEIEGAGQTISVNLTFKCVANFRVLPMYDFRKMGSDSENSCPSTPPEICELSKSDSYHMLPEKSKETYESAYKTYADWKTSKGANSSSESVLLAYFNRLAKQYKPTTIWSIYSKLKSTIMIKEKIDISSYKTLSAFLKKQSRGFRSKKASVFTSEQVQSFLTKAPDDKYLATKIVLIFGIFGALRTDELTNVQVQHIKEQGDLLQVQIPRTETMRPRSFIIAEDCAKYVKHYHSLRPANMPSNRFFINYRNGKCTAQVMGKNKFSGIIPKQIAEFLNLPNTESYTGRSFRRTSATILVDRGPNMRTLKRHGGWKSNTIAQGYIAESLGTKINTRDKIMSSPNLPSTSVNNCNSEISLPKRLRKDDSIDALPSSSKEIISAKVVTKTEYSQIRCIDARSLLDATATDTSRTDAAVEDHNPDVNNSKMIDDSLQRTASEPIEHVDIEIETWPSETKIKLESLPSTSFETSSNDTDDPLKILPNDKPEKCILKETIETLGRLLAEKSDTVRKLEKKTLSQEQRILKLKSVIDELRKREHLRKDAEVEIIE